MSCLRAFRKCVISGSCIPVQKNASTRSNSNWSSMRPNRSTRLLHKSTQRRKKRLPTGIRPKNPESVPIVGDHCGTSGACPDLPQLSLPCNISENRHANRDECINDMANSMSGKKNHGFPGHRRSAHISRNFPDFQHDPLSLAHVVPVKERSGEQKSLENCSGYPC